MRTIVENERNQRPEIKAKTDNTKDYRKRPEIHERNGQYQNEKTKGLKLKQIIVIVRGTKLQIRIKISRGNGKKYKNF